MSTNTEISYKAYSLLLRLLALAPASNIGGWGGDNSNSPNATTNPWFKRGGEANNGANAGVFAFNRNTGATNANIGWRAVVSGV